MPVLTALLGDSPPALAWHVEDLLFRVAGDDGPRASLGAGDGADRRKCREAWEGWWKTRGAGIDLAKVNWEQTQLGLTIIAELDGSGRAGNGRVWECGRDGKPRWENDGPIRPADAVALPGGRFLAAEHSGNRVTERSHDGKVLWEHRVDQSPVSCQRLPNGNTFIATYGELLEVTPDHKVVSSYRRPGTIFGAEKLRDGHIVYVTGNAQAFELDARGKEIRTIPAGNTGGWAGIERLANGHYLIARYGGGSVAEVDAAGKVYFEVRVPTAGFATRLPNGHTLVASIESRYVAEYDRNGKEVWRQATKGRPFRVRRR
jgi:hypothetical protein